MNREEKNKEEFYATIRLNLFVLKLSGIIGLENRFDDTDILATIAFLSLMAYAVAYCYQLATNISDLTVVSESFSMILPMIGALIRFVILLRTRGTCRAMLRLWQSFWSILKPDEKTIVHSYANKSNRLTWCYLSSCTVTIFLCAVFVFFDSAAFDQSDRFEYAMFISHTENRTGGGSSSSSTGSLDLSTDNPRHLPYVTIVTIRGTSWYAIAYVLQILLMINVACTCASIDTVGPMFIFVTCGYFEAIRRRIESYRFYDQPSLPLDSAETIFELRCTTDLRSCVIFHRRLLEFCQAIERFTNSMFLVQLLGSTYNISFIGVKLFEDSPDKLKYLSQLVIITGQLLLCNWPADILSSKSEDIANAAYSIPWYRYPCSVKTLTGMLIVRSQKPVRLTAGKFVQLSLETFASMISAAASFFAMIRSFN